MEHEHDDSCFLEKGLLRDLKCGFPLLKASGHVNLLPHGYKIVHDIDGYPKVIRKKYFNQ